MRSSIGERIGESSSAIELAFPTRSNEVFTHIPGEVIEHFAAASGQVRAGELDGTAPPRFVTAGDSKVEDVDGLLTAIARCSGDKY